MKIIIKGDYNNDFPMKVVCRRITDEYGFGYGDDNDFCGSVLEVDAQDIKKHNWVDEDHRGTDYGIICPVCGMFIPVEKHGIYKNILNNAEEIQIE